MKTKFFYSLILVSGLIFAGSSFNNIYGQKPKKITEIKATAKKHEMKYTCTMHPKVVMDKPGKCPKCGMKLVEMKDMKKEVKKEASKVKETTKKVKETTKMKEMPKK